MYLNLLVAYARFYNVMEQICNLNIIILEFALVIMAKTSYIIYFTTARI